MTIAFKIFPSIHISINFIKRNRIAPMAIAIGPKTGFRVADITKTTIEPRFLDHLMNLDIRPLVAMSSYEYSFVPPNKCLPVRPTR